MRYRLASSKASILFSILLSAGCSYPRAAEPVDRSRVVLISVDGGADWILDSLLTRQQLPSKGGFATIARHGLRGEALIPINVASTAPAHAAIFTGTLPERNGVVSNNFRMIGSPFDRRLTGFASELHAEPIWVTAMRQDKRVVCLAIPFADLTTRSRTCTRTLPYGVTEPGGGGVRLSGVVPGPEAPSVPLQSHSGSMTVRAGGTNIPLFARAERTTGGAWTIAIDFDAVATNGAAATLAAGGSAFLKLEVPGRRLHASVQAQRIEPDLTDVRLYIGPAAGTAAGPATDDAYVTMLDGTIGLFPADVDNASLARGEISVGDWHAQNEAIGRYVQAAVLRALRAPDWDLLITYMPVVDNVSHRFLVTNPRQADFAAEEGRRRRAFADHLLRGYRFADDVLRSFIDAAPPGTHFVIVSDHGMVPTHSTLLLQNYLESRGFRIKPDSLAEVVAVTSQADAQIYVNLKGREPDGRVEATDYDAVVSRLATTLRELRDPKTQTPIFRRVATRAELQPLGLLFPQYSGDVFVSAAPGWGLMGQYVPGAPILVPRSLEPDTQTQLSVEDPARKEVYRNAGWLQMAPGLHGHLGDEHTIEGIFLAYGPRVKHGRCGRVRAIDVASSVATLLEIQPSPSTQGRSAIPTQLRQ